MNPRLDIVRNIARFFLGSLLIDLLQAMKHVWGKIRHAFRTEGIEYSYQFLMKKISQLVLMHKGFGI